MLAQSSVPLGDLGSFTVTVEEILTDGSRVVEVHRVSPVWVVPSLGLLIVNLYLFLSFSEVIMFRHVLFNPASPSVEVLLLARERFVGDQALHHGTFVKVHIHQVPHHTLRACIFRARDNPFFLRVKAIRVRCSAHLIKHSFSNESGTLLDYHSNLGQMSLFKLK